MPKSAKHNPLHDIIQMADTKAIQKACDYLNQDKDMHIAAHGKWNLDPGKLLMALALARITER